MFFEEGVAYAMTKPGGEGQGGGDLLTSLMPLFIIVGLFWFLILRPQQKKQKEQDGMREALKKGDNVITASGIYGKITGISENVVTLEIAPKVKIKVHKPQIAGLSKPDGSGEASEG